MKNDEIVTALRCCASIDGSGCGICPSEELDGKEICCGDALKLSAADTLEKLLDRCARYAEEIAVLQERQRWIPVTERLPEITGLVLVIVSGKPRKNVELIDALELGEYADDGWCLESWPEWTDANVTHWMPLPETPEVE